jgi:protein disulfide-isomerase A6
VAYKFAPKLTLPSDCKSLAPIWEQLALDFVNEPSVVIAKIDAESPDSKKTAKDEGVTGFPTIKFFAAGTDKSTLYEGARTEQSLIDFVNKQTGTFRSVGGRLSDAAGTIPSIDDVLQKIVDAGSDFAGKAEDVLSAIKGEKGQYAEYYGKVVEKIKKNAGYVNKELTRLEGILKKGTLAPQKLDDLTTRRNILRKFKATDEKSEL